MQTLYVSERTGKDGILNVRVPLGVPEREYDVVLVAQPREATRAPSPSDLGWPPGYFEDTFGSITDETFVHPSRSPL